MLKACPKDAHLVLVFVQRAQCKVACWHADMNPDQIAQVGRMLQEGNVLSASDAALVPDKASSDARFVHPDEVRDMQQRSQEQVQPASPAADTVSAHVMVTTDAALKRAPEVPPVRPLTTLS